MKKNKKTKWLIGLSSVAAFTGFVGLLNKSNTITHEDVAASASINNGSTQSEQTMPNTQNPFSDDNSSKAPSSGSGSDSEGSVQNGQSPNSSDSWAGDYEGNNSNSANNGNSSENGTQDSFSQQPPNGQNNGTSPFSNGQNTEGQNSFEQGQGEEITGRSS
ncbi:hypothetical protein [Niallia sp. NCCP-28]|uniref:hypothetical protein n=1 Tax=Niallia sp. NCCP-28 TaxID=2934712 RepID=UPI002085606F|nr:hypothetical protein [Niallia sp. NCCP-28]GKU83655.1 hypothetical protein NCCP28_30510 [Niallia sp. NCCP-28]